MGGQIHIRRAEIGDCDDIASVLRAAFLEFEPLYTPEAFQATTPDADTLRKRWAEGPVWAAEWAGQICGTVAAVPGPESLYIRSMGVLPKAHGQGIGERLLEAVNAYAQQSRLRRLYLSTTPFLTGAIRLYENFGFVRNDTGPHHLFGTPLFTLEKFLASGELRL